MSSERKNERIRVYRKLNEVNSLSDDKENLKEESENVKEEKKKR